MKRGRVVNRFKIPDEEYLQVGIRHFREARLEKNISMMSHWRWWIEEFIKTMRFNRGK